MATKISIGDIAKALQQAVYESMAARIGESLVLRATMYVLEDEARLTEFTKSIRDNDEFWKALEDSGQFSNVQEARAEFDEKACMAFVHRFVQMLSEASED